MTVTHPISPPLRIKGKIIVCFGKDGPYTAHWDIGKWYIGKYSKESREAVVVGLLPGVEGGEEGGQGR